MTQHLEQRSILSGPTQLVDSLRVDVSQVWRHMFLTLRHIDPEAHVSDPDRTARFLACDGTLKVFQAVVIKSI